MALGRPPVTPGSSASLKFLPEEEILKVWDRAICGPLGEQHPPPEVILPAAPPVRDRCRAKQAAEERVAAGLSRHFRIATIEVVAA